MSKKLLSLALALAISLGLTLPACAAESTNNLANTTGKAGSSTFNDTKGNTYTLSNPILYTLTRSDIEEIETASMKISIEGEPYDEELFGSASDYLNESFWSRMDTVYALPEGTVVTLPGNITTWTVFELDVTWEDKTCYATEFNVINYPGFTSVPLDGDGYILGVELQYADREGSGNTTSTNGGGASGTEVGSNVAGMVFFYVPEAGATSTENPFASANTPTTPTTPSTPKFTDIAANACYADAVAWAVEKDITAGTSDTTFSPESTCTTAQILTFLWRSQGQPEPTIKNQFTDVKESDYFHKAALWASEKGLISGSTFGGNTPCTRAATVTYLWKLAGSPSAPAASFADIPGDSEYASAVAYAVSEKITAGTSATTFSPEATCTRGQIVTFLYRAYGK